MDQVGSRDMTIREIVEELPKDHHARKQFEGMIIALNQYACDENWHEGDDVHYNNFCVADTDPWNFGTFEGDYVGGKASREALEYAGYPFYDNSGFRINPKGWRP